MATKASAAVAPTQFCLFRGINRSQLRPTLAPFATARTMSTIILKAHGVPVTLPEGLPEDQLLSFEPFNTWVARITRSLSLQARSPQHPFHSDPYKLRSVTIQSFDLFSGGRLGFLKLVSEVANASGSRLPGAVFLRGPSVAMLVILVPDDVVPPRPGTADRYVLLTVQPRVPAGSLAFVELPAGMVDEDGGFAGAAAREMKEELGLDIRAGQLTCLSEMAVIDGPDNAPDAAAVDTGFLPRAMYPSAGGCDEYIPIYMHERRVPRAQLGEWSGRLTGLRDHGEKITLKLVRMGDLWREGARDAKCLAALALWEGLQREGKL